MGTYAITDMRGFIKSVRDGAAESICESYTENLDDFITVPQIEKLVINKSVGTDDNGDYLITEAVFDDILEEVRGSIYQAGLSKLAAKGIIECAWDDDSNEMVFWLSSTTQGNQEIKARPSDDE